MKTNHIQYRIGDTPYVWVVKLEYGCNVYFKYENALKAYNDEFCRLNRDSKFELSVNVNEPDEKTHYAVFYCKNNFVDERKKVVISVDDRKIMDAKIYD